ncbi:MAG: sigma-70 family RNA polymerase sigma factor [Candidatus Latescibacteria bacterium]|nr:sigma-70 family RNA polymerase sigma factor [Candidatus Latescibacterota bacterium]
MDADNALSCRSDRSTRFSPMSAREPQRPSDARLMEAIAAGSHEAFGRLVDRHHQRALDFAYRFLGDRDEAKDAVQEAFLSILGAADRYRPASRFTTYLLAVVRNAALQRVRSRRRRREEPLEELAMDRPEGSIPATGRDPERDLERAELRDLLAGAIAALPPEIREVFLFNEMHGLRYREIAEICGCPIGTVASRKHEAVKRLRARLGARGRL